eukprot:1307443-Rhodomonas_salina.3
MSLFSQSRDPSTGDVRNTRWECDQLLEHAKGAGSATRIHVLCMIRYAFPGAYATSYQDTRRLAGTHLVQIASAHPNAASSSTTSTPSHLICTGGPPLCTGGPPDCSSAHPFCTDGPPTPCAARCWPKTSVCGFEQIERESGGRIWKEEAK